MRRGLLLALLVFASNLGLGAGTALGATAQGALLLLDDGAMTMSSDSLLVALSAQLAPYEVAAQRQRWHPTGKLADRVRLARQLGDAASADYALFCQLRRQDGLQVMQAVVIDLRGGQLWWRALTVGQPTFGIERSVAAVVVTLLRSRVAKPPRVPRPLAKPPTSRPVVARPQPIVRRPARPIERPSLSLDAGYRVALLLGEAALRHGPEVELGWRAWRRLEVALIIGYRFEERGSLDDATWSRSGLALGARGRWAWPLARSWDLVAGGYIGVLRVSARASSPAGRQALMLWEAHLGVSVGLSWRLSRFLGFSVGTRLAWIPAGHRIVVGGQEVARSGGAEASGMVALRGGF